MAEPVPRSSTASCWINQEFGNVDPSPGRTPADARDPKKYAPSIAPQAFGQMGFMDAKFATQALLSVKGAVTAKSYNTAVRGLKNVKTDMLCKPWYVGNDLAVPHPEQHGHHRRLQGRQGRR